MSPFSLALKELRFEPISAFCYAFALCGILVPLMVALSLKHGALDRTIELLVSAPQNREIYLQGVHKITLQDVRSYKEIEGLDFVMPIIRPINAEANSATLKTTGQKMGRTEIIPTMPGDPLLEGAQITLGQVYVTESLHQALGAPANLAAFDVVFERNKGTLRQAAIFNTQIAGTVRHALHPEPAILVHIDDMIKVEAFRDDPNITPGNWYQRFKVPSSFASLRTYARSLGEVEEVVEELKDRGLRAKPRNDNVPLMLQLQRGADIIYGLLAVMGLLGYAVAMTANLRAWTQRRRSDYSLLKLMRHKTAKIAVIPVLQNLVMTYGGFALAIVLTLLINALVNFVFNPAGANALAILTFGDIVGFLLGLFVVVVLSSIWAVKTIIDVETKEVLING